MINRLLHGCWYCEACGDPPVLNMSVEILHLMGGTNDLAGNGGVYPSVDDIASNLANISTIATSRGMRVLLASVLPATSFYWRPDAPPPSARIVQLNALLAAFANTTANVTFVDYHAALTNDVGGMGSAFTTDGVHVTASGYGVMQSVLQPHLFFHWCAPARASLPSLPGLRASRASPQPLARVRGSTHASARPAVFWRPCAPATPGRVFGWPCAPATPGPDERKPQHQRAGTLSQANKLAPGKPTHSPADGPRLCGLGTHHPPRKRQSVRVGRPTPLLAQPG